MPEHGRNLVGATALAVCGMVLVACADTSAEGGSAAAEPDPTADASAPSSPGASEPTLGPARSAPAGASAGALQPTVPSKRIDPALATFVDQARDDLSSRLGVARADVQPVAAVAVVWPDAALGCPQPGMRYTQVPQDGAVLELRAEQRFYRYHVGGRSLEPFPCSQPWPPGVPILDG